MINILIVEDDIRILNFCTNALSRLHTNIIPIPVVSAEDALDALTQNTIEGAIIDIILPGMDGFSLAEHIRDMDDYYYLPIIFATGETKDVPDTYKKYRNIDYVSKPYGIEAFNAAALRMLKEIGQQKRLSKTKREREILFQYDDGLALIFFLKFFTRLQLRAVRSNW